MIELCIGSHSPTLTSSDGVVAFAMWRRGFRVCVRRFEKQVGSGCERYFTIEALFDGHDEFMRWCDADPLRLQYPQLYQNLTREFDEFIAGR
jgi:hypothetical protein